MPQRLDVSQTPRRRRARVGGTESVGKWQLLQLIGEGQWTHVHRSRPQESIPQNADYAVKVLKPQFQTDPLAISLLQREALVARQVRHVHLTSVLTHHAHAPPYYLVSPFLVGVSLRAALAAVEQIAVPQALWIVRQIAEALRTLHLHGWRHADVKPENILVGPNGHSTLLDLGLAERFEDIARGDAIKGSPAYWSPESCCDDQVCGAPSDIYSLGITLFESVTGRCPFVADNAMAMAAAHREQELPDPRIVVPQMCPRVRRLLRAMLAKDPNDRPTIEQLIDRLVDLEIDALSERVA